MKESYIINEKICFVPDENHLVSLDGKEVAMVLNVPVSRCLLLLLQRPGEVISQDELVQEVWEKKGQYANANTYFQNIYLLRKALKGAGVVENVIKTVPKEGVRFTGKVSHRVFQKEDLIITPQSSTSDHEVSMLLEETKTTRIQKHLGSYLVSKLTSWYFPFLTVMLTLCIVYFITQLYLVTSSNKEFLVNYIHIGKANQCQVYADITSNEQDKLFYLNFIKKEEIQCRVNQVAYMVKNIESDKILAHVCDKSVSNVDTCTTKIFYIENADEH